MRKIAIGLCIALSVGALSSCSNASKSKVDDSLKIIDDMSQFHQKLKNAHQHGIMFGHQDATVYGIGWEGDNDRSDVHSICGDYPAVMGWDVGHIELGHSHSLDSVSFDKIRAEILKQHQRGGLNTISWHLNNPLTGGDSWDLTGKDKVVSSILPQGENHEKFKTWLDRLATYLSSLKTPEGTKVPILFRPWHEHTGSWFWWGRDLCTPEEYKSLWIFTYQYLKEKGVDNIIYAYSPGGDPEDVYMERYPGDQYVDLLGFDTYQQNSDEKAVFFKEQMASTLTFLKKLGEKHNKPIAITETGFETIPDAHWWTQVLLPIVQDYPLAYVLVWRNAREKPNHYYAPYPEHISANDFVDFYNNNKTLFAKDIKTLYK